MDIVDKRTNCAFIQYVFPKESLLWTFSVLLFPSITTADQRSESSDVARTGFTNCYAILRVNIDLLWFYFEPCLSVFDIIWGYCRQLSVSHPFSGCSLSQWFYQTILNQQLDSRYIHVFLLELWRKSAAFNATAFICVWNTETTGYHKQKWTGKIKFFRPMFPF